MKYTTVISRGIIYTDTNKLFQWFKDTLADSVVLKLLMKDEFQSCYFWKKLLWTELNEKLDAKIQGLISSSGYVL